MACLSTALSELESRVLALYLDGHSYEEVGEPARLRLQDGRQRAAARQAQGRPAPDRAQRSRSRIAATPPAVAPPAAPPGRRAPAAAPPATTIAQPAIGPRLGSSPYVLNARNSENSRWPGPWKSDEPVLSSPSSVAAVDEQLASARACASRRSTRPVEPARVEASIASEHVSGSGTSQNGCAQTATRRPRGSPRSTSATVGIVRERNAGLALDQVLDEECRRVGEALGAPGAWRWPGGRRPPREMRAADRLALGGAAASDASSSS